MHAQNNFWGGWVSLPLFIPPQERKTYSVCLSLSLSFSVCVCVCLCRGRRGGQSFWGTAFFFYHKFLIDWYPPPFLSNTNNVFIPVSQKGVDIVSFVHIFLARQIQIRGLGPTPSPFKSAYDLYKIDASCVASNAIWRMHWRTCCMFNKRDDASQCFTCL